MDNELTGVEDPEVAAPEETPAAEGATTQEPAVPGTAGEPAEETPPARDLERDAAFARLRREAEDYKRQHAEAMNALTAFFGTKDPVETALSQATGKTVEEVRAEREAQNQAETLRLENEALKQRLVTQQAESAMKRDLAEIQKLDPKVKSLDELGEVFLNLVSTGKVSAAEAYYATRAKQEKEAKTAPPTVGQLNTSPKEKDYYTPDEVRAMSPDEVRKNLDKINKSMSKWK